MSFRTLEDQAIGEGVDFDEWKPFDDRPSDDPTVGPARAVEITGRCTDCWGPATGTKDGDGRWICIQCRLCGRSIDGEDAAREAELMYQEAERNVQPARVGRGLEYREDARFVLKVLPDMDREKARFDERVAAKQAEKQRRGWLGRRDFPKGTAGYLFAQARAFLSGLENMPPEMSAISFSDFDFGEPQIVGVTAANRVAAMVPVRHRKPSDRALMARMGTTMVASMAAAFACELGMKAILMTRLDEVEKTHDLVKLYNALPEDSRRRLEADFPGIEGVLEDNRHSFEKWRYFEESVGERAMVALVNTARVRELGKAARVIVDECIVAGLTYEIHVDTEFHITVDRGDVSRSDHIGLRVKGGESAIPWDRVLMAGSSGTRV